MIRYSSSPFGRVPLIGMGEVAPLDYVYPVAQDYVSGVAQGVKEATSFSADDLGIVMTPVGKSTAAGVRTLMEAAGGTDISSIIIGAVMPDAPAMLSSMLKDLMDNVLDVVISAVGQAVADALGGALQSIPFAGQFMGYLVQAISLLAGSAEAEQAAKNRQRVADDEAHKAHQTYCSWWLSHALNVCAPGQKDMWGGGDEAPAGGCPGSVGQKEACTPISTGDGGVQTPADMFRPIAYNLSPDGRRVLTTAPGVPWCPTACYVWLCGGEAPIGLGRKRYDALLAKARAQSGDPKIGLPKEVQRAMWALIRGICTATQDPDPVKPKPHRSDQGRSLYPILVDMILRSWKPYVIANNLKTEGYWDDAMLRVFAEDQALNYHASGRYVDEEGYAASGSYRNSCAEYQDIVGVYDPSIGALGDTGFLTHIGLWGRNLQQNFMDDKGNIVGTPTSRTAKAFLASGKSRSIVQIKGLTAATTKVLTGKPTGGTTLKPYGESGLTMPQKAVLASGGLGGSYLLYRGIQEATRLLRSR